MRTTPTGLSAASILGGLSKLSRMECTVHTDGMHEWHGPRPQLCTLAHLQVVKTISTIKTSGSRLLNLVNDILDAASMRKGKLAVKHEKVNLHKIVDDVVELTGPLVGGCCGGSWWCSLWGWGW